jgi:hypothetical protein
MKETIEECYERLHLMANGDEQWDLSNNDRWAIANILVHFDCVKKQLHELREAVSPGRIGKPEYYIGVAARLRSLDGTVSANVCDIVHGANCPKKPHTRTGYLHGEDDDTPYNVDGLKYCGRCHTAL